MLDPTGTILPFKGRGWAAYPGLRLVVERYWEGQRALLLTRIEHALDHLCGLAALEEQLHRGYADEQAFASSLGSFSANTVEPRHLYALVKKERKRRQQGSQRLERIGDLAAELEACLRQARREPPGCQFIAPDGGVEETLALARDHLERHARVVHLLHLARLEEKGKQPRHPHGNPHEAWRGEHAGMAEFNLIPPCLVLMRSLEEDAGVLADVLRLVHSGLPVKLILPTSLDTGDEGPAGLPSLGASLELESVMLSLRKVYFIQTPLRDDPDTEAILAGGLGAPLPCVISLAVHHEPAAPEARWMHEAVASRAFPKIVFNPMHRHQPGGGLELAGNPRPDHYWALEPLACRTGPEESAGLEREYTFADFAYGHPALRGHFHPVPQDAHRNHMTPLADFLRAPPALRGGKTPYLQVTNEKGQPEQVVPSPAMIALTEGRLELWLALRKAAGGTMESPEPHGAEAAPLPPTPPPEETPARETPGEAYIRERERAAVAKAMGELVLRLHEMTGEGMDLNDLLGQAAQTTGMTGAASGATGSEGAPEEDGPTIDTEECTACDECININPAIFDYNSDQKAIIKNPRGGPYRDIVKAAEKCQAMIIRPGLPLERGQPELAKWIERARPFN